MWTEAIRALPVAFSLLTGSGEQSHYVRPVSDVYHQAEQSHSRLSALTGSYRRSTRLRLDGLGGSSTADSGAKLGMRHFIASEPTGDDLALYSSAGIVAPSWSKTTPPLDVSGFVPTHSRAVRWILEIAGLKANGLGDLIGVERQTVQNWKAGAGIRPGHLRSLLEIQDVLLRAMPERSNRGELAAWLITPDRHDGVTPAELIQRGEFDRARLLAVMSPSAVEPMPAWANRPVAEAWRGAIERREGPGEFIDE